MQVHAAVTHGFWYARSAEFLQQPLMQTLVWLRMPGDVVFAAGAGMLALFVARLYIGKRKPAPLPATPVAEATTGR
jgi:nitric oxide reductase subunit B